MNKTLFLCLVLALLAGASSAFAITVVVNGQQLPSSPPAIQRNDRVLLPMRMVFESLGATVNWDARNQSIVATRGDKVINMTILQPTAYVGGRAVVLDVPPQLIGESTYVPVRFPAEAFGADVGWMAATQTVTIDLPETEANPPDSEPPPAPTTDLVSGTISSITSRRISILVDGDLQAYTLTPDTTLESQGEEISYDDLQAGDLVRIEYGRNNQAISVKASYETVQGVIESLGHNTILLDNTRQPLRVQTRAKIVSESGDTISFADLAEGDRVVLRVNPDTDDVYSITVRSQGTQRELRIISDFEGTLSPGDVYRLTIVGPPDAIASFNIGDWMRNLELREDPDNPGVYSGRFTVPNFTQPREEPLVVTLRTREGRTMTARGESMLRFRSSPDTGEVGLRLMSPLQDDQVGADVVIEGYADPFAEVTVNITWEGIGADDIRDGGTLTRVRLTADSRGLFRSDPVSLAVNSSLDPEDIRYKLTATARDRQGQQSEPLTVEFTQ